MPYAIVIAVGAFGLCAVLAGLAMRRKAPETDLSAPWAGELPRLHPCDRTERKAPVARSYAAHRWVLSSEDAAAVLGAIDNPPEPTPRAMEAGRQYGCRVASAE